MTTRHLLDNHAQMLAQFRWHVSASFNIAEVCVRRWAMHSHTALRLAVISHRLDAPAVQHSFAQVQAAADALSHVLAAQGVQAGDRVAVVLPQRFETVVAYTAIWQMGAVVMPLSQLFGPEALQYRLQDSGAVLAVVDAVSSQTVADLKSSCSALRCWRS